MSHRMSSGFPTLGCGRVGIYKTLDAVKAAFRENECLISSSSADLMIQSQFILSREKRDVEWVAMPARQLGFTDPYTLEALIDRAEKNFGLERCQPEDGVYTRLGYAGQAAGRWLRIAMDPIATSGRLGNFGLGRDHVGLWLTADRVSPQFLWGIDVVWVLRLSCTP